MNFDKYKFVSLFPDKYASKEWIVYSEDFGIYSKKEAEIITDFIRQNFHKMVEKCMRNRLP